MLRISQSIGWVSAKLMRSSTKLSATKLLPTNIRQDIIERTDGIPLFVEEMTNAVLEAANREARNTQLRRCHLQD